MSVSPLYHSNQFPACRFSHFTILATVPFLPFYRFRRFRFPALSPLSDLPFSPYRYSALPVLTFYHFGSTLPDLPFPILPICHFSAISGFTGLPVVLIPGPFGFNILPFCASLPDLPFYLSFLAFRLYCTKRFAYITGAALLIWRVLPF